jgi:transcriptional regulator with GAF, ATPase, and Fis domain
MTNPIPLTYHQLRKRHIAETVALIEHAIETTSSGRHAAEALGVTSRQFYRLLDRYHIPRPHNRNGGARSSSIDRRILAEMLDAGQPKTKMAERFNVTVYGINSAIQRWGLSSKRRDNVQKVKSIQEKY